MHVLSSAPLAGSAWSFGGSILTFAFPEILFIAVAATLWVLYTKPELVPGHWIGAIERPVSYTAVPGQPAAEAADAGEPAAAQGGQAATMEQGQTAAAEQGQPAAMEQGQTAAAEQGQPAAAEQGQAAPAEQGEARMQDGEAAGTGDGE